MATLVRIDSSMDRASSRSRRLTQAFADTWRGRFGADSVIERDLHRSPLPYLTDANLHWPPARRGADVTVDDTLAQLQDELIAEVEAADVLVIGLPLYNLSLPATLKTWVDYVHVAGRTSGVTPPPFAGRTAVICTARGGSYAPGSPTESWDHATPALTLILGRVLGMTVESVAVDLTLSDGASAPDSPAQAQLTAALDRVSQLAATLSQRSI